MSQELTGRVAIARVVLVDHLASRAEFLREALESCDYQVIAVLRSSADILARADMLAPDMILADMESPDRDTIEDVRLLMQRRPCPIVMYHGRKDAVSIQKAIDAGVSAYVTDDIAADDVKSILDIASARFQQFSAMSEQLRDAKTELANRKEIDKAKSLLMKHHGLDENDAHKTLQRLAMNQRVSLADAARNVAAMLVALSASGDSS
ncbi:MAG: ANTAR domain-containing protein [Pseudomonadota bacterium]